MDVPTRAALSKRDARLAVAIATAWMMVLLLGPYLVAPWGPATPTTRNLAAFWTDVPLVTDFIAFWTGAFLVREGAGPTLYDPERQRAFQLEQRAQLASTEDLRRFAGTAAYLYPPPLALLFTPLTLLPMPWAYGAWALASLLALAAAVALPLRGRLGAMVPSVMMLTSAAVTDTLMWGQVNGLFALVLSLGLLALSAGRPVLGGALLGLLWLKPQQAVLFPLVFLLKGRWREMAGMAASAGAIAVLSLLMVGPEGLARYLNLVEQAGGFHARLDVVTTPERMNNWRAMILHAWPGVDEATGLTLVTVLGAITILGSFVAWRGPWEPSSPRFPRQMLVLALAAVVAVPHSHFHGTALLLAPLALALARPMPGAPLEGVWRPMLTLGYALGLGLLPFRTAFWLLVPYFVVAMALLTWQVCSKRDPRRPPETPKLVN